MVVLYLIGTTDGLFIAKVEELLLRDTIPVVEVQEDAGGGICDELEKLVDLNRKAIVQIKEFRYQFPILYFMSFMTILLFPSLVSY